MTIEVKNTPTQSVEIFNKNSRQEIDVINALEQKISISEQKGTQDIDVDNVTSQEVKVTQDFIIVPVYDDVPLYEGDYDATPKLVEQRLPTKNKLLIDDVKIEKIPITIVSNSSGGNTVIIGG